MATQERVLSFAKFWSTRVVSFTHQLDSLVVECWLRVPEVLGSRPRHTKDDKKMASVVPVA